MKQVPGSWLWAEGVLMFIVVWIGILVGINYGRNIEKFRGWTCEHCGFLLVDDRWLPAKPALVTIEGHEFYVHTDCVWDFLKLNEGVFSEGREVEAPGEGSEAPEEGEGTYPSGPEEAPDDGRFLFW